MDLIIVVYPVLHFDHQLLIYLLAHTYSYAKHITLTLHTITITSGTIPVPDFMSPMRPLLILTFPPAVRPEPGTLA